MLVKIALIVIFTGGAVAHPTSTPRYVSSFTASNSNPIFQVGEELVYNVSYASFNLGQVRVKIVEAIRDSDQTRFKATAYIDSYKGVPFVNLHAVYESTFGENVHSEGFLARTKENDAWMSVLYTFDYRGRALYVDRGVWKSGKMKRVDTMPLDTFYQDGLSIFYFARRAAGGDRKLSVPTVVNEKKGTTFIKLPGRLTTEEIDAIAYPVDAIHFEGEAGFVGIFGLTGGFEGWFSNDAARVPILAKMNVLIGKVRIELMRWTREGWNPPKADAGRRR